MLLGLECLISRSFSGGEEELKKKFRTQKHQADVFGVGTGHFRDRG